MYTQYMHERKGFYTIGIQFCCKTYTLHDVVNAPSVDSFKNRLDKQWSNEEIVYDYKAAAPAGRKIYAPAGTQDLTIEAKACGHEDT